MFYLGFFGFLGFLSYRLLAPSWKRLLLLLVFSALVGLVGLSRLYLGVHWAGDVLGAYLAGGLLLATAIQVYHSDISRFFTHQR
jgi:undecaprenyl-diphosphatase